LAPDTERIAVRPPFSRPLLATEHTEFDVGAQQLAFDYARKHALPLAAVLPLVSNPEFEVVAPDEAARAEREAAVRCAQLRIDAERAGVAVDVQVRRAADAWRAIVEDAAARAADVVVVRRRGRRGFLANLMLGEMAGNVATHAACSVLLVPRACGLWSRRVVAGVDQSPGALRVATEAGSLAAAQGIPLMLVGVAVEDSAVGRAAARSGVEAVSAAAAAAGAAVEAMIEVGRPAAALASVAARLGADLIVVGRGGRTHALKRRLLGSTAGATVGLAGCPVLVVRTED
jgi:nucleotide-binding universal stress UspA family protein